MPGGRGAPATPYARQTGLPTAQPVRLRLDPLRSANRLGSGKQRSDLTTARTHAADLVDILLDCPVPDSPGWAAPWPPGAAST